MLIISTSESTCCVLLYVDSVVGHEPEDCMGHFCVIKHYIELFEPVFSFLGFWVKFLVRRIFDHHVQCEINTLAPYYVVVCILPVSSIALISESIPATLSFTTKEMKP